MVCGCFASAIAHGGRFMDNDGRGSSLSFLRHVVRFLRAYTDGKVERPMPVPIRLHAGS
jgi:hypothetical protein